MASPIPSGVSSTCPRGIFLNARINQAAANAKLAIVAPVLLFIAPSAPNPQAIHVRILPQAHEKPRRSGGVRLDRRRGRVVATISHPVRQQASHRGLLEHS